MNEYRVCKVQWIGPAEQKPRPFEEAIGLKTRFISLIQKANQPNDYDYDY